MKIIELKLSESSISDVISKFKELENNLKTSSENIINDMVNETENQIKINYSASPYTDGNDDVNIFKTKDEYRYKVGAEGTQVLYREFGTGTEGLNAPHPIKGNFPLQGYNTGNKIRVNSKNGDLYWIYKDSSGNPVYTQGIPAGKEIYNAAIVLKGKKYTIIKKRVGEAISKL